jgi:AraC-like DNA-binding protein
MAPHPTLQTASWLNGNSAKAILLQPYDEECINSAQQILSKDPQIKISLEELSAKTGINRTKLCYGFKQMFGLTIHAFLERQRMQRAAFLLATTHKPIKMIAAITGYCNSSRFGVVFKKEFGITPFQYRRQAKVRAGKNDNMDTICDIIDSSSL